MEIIRHAPKVSIILPTYNQAIYLKQCIDSVLSQSFSDLEFIIVNDGSTDNTSQILSAYKDNRIQIITQENKGLPSALNEGFHNAKGEFLTWISSDCWCEPNFIEILAKELDENPWAGLVYSDIKIIYYDQRSEIVRLGPLVDYDELVYEQTRGVGASFMYRDICRQAVGEYDTKLFGREDRDYWIRIAKTFKLKHVAGVLYNYRVHAQNLSSTMDFTDVAINVYLKILNQRDTSISQARLKNKINNIQADLYFTKGWKASSNSRIIALKYYLKSLYYRKQYKTVLEMAKLLIP